jgi:hypothetical protein
MKEKISIIILGILLFLYGCDGLNKNKPIFENKQQEDFSSFLKTNEEQNYYSNDIQKKEFYNKFDKELSSYLDSIKIFTNWKANIKDIKTREIRGYTEISFELYYKPGEYQEISFFCSYLVKSDSLKNDYLYNAVRNISDYSTVYFDGFIKKDKNNNVIYDYGSEDIKIAYPNYKFNVVEISNTKNIDSLSQPLKKAIDIDFKVFDLLKQKANKKISSGEWDRRMKSLPINKIESELNPAEKKYILRLRQYLYDDFMTL